MAAQQNPLDDLKRYITPIEEVIEEAREGRMFILVDAEDRENEGDLIIPAQFATPEKVNFMARFGRGLICLALTDERTRQLGLEPMSRRNGTQLGTAFTVSIEAKEGITTGISAHDRAHTIAVAIDPTKNASDIVSPGHVFPLAARPGGALVRAGHTEASVDIARLAGLLPAAVICEIMNDDGTMARLPELIAFAQFHNLKIGTIADLISYRGVHDHMIDRVTEGPMPSRFGDQFKYVVFRNNIDGAEYPVVVRGDIKPDKPTLVRMHRLHIGFDLLGAAGPRAGLLEEALAEIGKEEGPGVLVLLRGNDPQELTRAAGLAPVEQSPSGAAAPQLREYGVGAQILRELGVRQMIMLSDAPQRVVGLEGYGLTIVGWRHFKHQSKE
ncbi:MAG: 3,4-dihydroxy-2-butanone-4-phosphate synthase [Caulobacterales bacterium]